MKITTKKASSGSLPYLLVTLMIVACILLFSSCAHSEMPQYEARTTPYRVAECLNRDGTISTALVRADDVLTSNWQPGWVWNNELSMNVSRYVRTK